MLKKLKQLRKKKSSQINVQTGMAANILPEEILSVIFLFSKLKDMPSIARVCKRWAKIAETVIPKIDICEGQLWSDKIRDEITSSPPVYEAEYKTQYKKFYEKHSDIRFFKEDTKAKIVLRVISGNFSTSYDDFFDRLVELVTKFDDDIILKRHLDNNPIQSKKLLFKNTSHILALIAGTMVYERENSFKLLIDIMKKNFNEQQLIKLMREPVSLNVIGFSSVVGYSKEMRNLIEISTLIGNSHFIRTLEDLSPSDEKIELKR